MDTPTLPLLQNCSWAFVRMGPVIVLAKFEVRSFTRSWDNTEYLKNFLQSLDTPFKVIQGLDFGTNRKRVYDFISVSYTHLTLPTKRIV